MLQATALSCLKSSTRHQLYSIKKYLNGTLGFPVPRLEGGKKRTIPTVQEISRNLRFSKILYRNQHLDYRQYTWFSR